jgi:NAD(P)-dependent dehydrogenase (short-subunit alcohol dehydrogenase family)
MGNNQLSSITLRQSRIVVAGGTSGIGFAVAEAAARAGAEVIIASSNPERVGHFSRASTHSTTSSTLPVKHCSCKTLPISASTRRSELSKCATGARSRPLNTGLP